MLKSAKWLARQAKPFIFSIIMIIVTGVLTSLVSVGVAVVSKNLIDAATSLDKTLIITASVYFAVLIVSEISIDVYNSYLSARTSELLTNSMRENLLKRMAVADWHSISKYHSDDILTRLTSDISVAADAVINTVPSVISLSFLLAAAFITLFIYDPFLSLLAFVLGPVTVLFSRFYAKRISRLHIDAQEAEAKTRGFIHEAVQNIIIIKAFRLEKRSLATVNKLQNDKLRLVLARNKLGIFSNALLSLGYWAGYILAFGWGAYRLAEGMITFGTLVAFLQLVDNVQSPFSGLAHAIPQIITSAASAKRLMKIEYIEQEEPGRPAPKRDKYGIVFDDISFGYEQNKAVLKNVSFEIRPGEIVCLMGPSGEGKTTILRLLMSLLKPDGGHIYFTGINGEKAEACSSCRDFIAYVPQGNTLFSGTIAENLRLGNENASDYELEAATRMAAAWSFIEKLPDGLNTEIGERGMGISEGQAQRIAIARALLRKTPVLLLDEATSSLDMNVEKEILKGIEQLTPAITCIVVTHRKSVMEICDRVLILENGEVKT